MTGVDFSSHELGWRTRPGHEFCNWPIWVGTWSSGGQMGAKETGGPRHWKVVCLTRRSANAWCHQCGTAVDTYGRKTPRL